MVSIRCGTLCASGSKPCSDTGKKPHCYCASHKRVWEGCNIEFSSYDPSNKVRRCFPLNWSCTFCCVGHPDTAIEYPLRRSLKKRMSFFLSALCVALDLVAGGFFQLHNSLCSERQGTDPLQFGAFTPRRQNYNDSTRMAEGTKAVCGIVLLPFEAWLQCCWAISLREKHLTQQKKKRIRS